jgi:hypothetical protein
MASVAPSSPSPAPPLATDAPATALPRPTPEPLATAPAVTAAETPQAIPAAPSPAAAADERLSRPEEAEALAGAPASQETPAAPIAAPTAVVLPPSARLLPGSAAAARTPTPNVVASSPALAPPAAVLAGGADYPRAVKLVQDARKRPAGPRLEERIDAAVARARATGREVEVLGWQAALKGTTDLYQVSFMFRENRQGLRAEWEVNLATGEVRAANPVAEALDDL